MFRLLYLINLKIKLEKTVYNIDLNRGNMKLAVLADFHNGDPQESLDVMKKDVPDAIVIPGDLVMGYRPKKETYVIDHCNNIIPFLKGCVETAPTYMSIGNHECILCDDEYDRLRATGITLLDNDWTELRSGEAADRILIGGLTSGLVVGYRRFRDNYNRNKAPEDREIYPKRKVTREVNNYPPDSSWLEDFERQEGYKILLSHHPEYWCLREPMLRNRKIDLVISGHAHGGQWNVKGRGIYSPGQGFLPKYTSGVHDGPHGKMIISRGIHNPYRRLPRWGNPCEVIYIQINTLR